MVCMHKNWGTKTSSSRTYDAKTAGRSICTARQKCWIHTEQRKIRTASDALFFCKHFDRTEKLNKWVITHLEGFLFGSYSKWQGMRPLSLSVCWTGTVVKAWFLWQVCVVILLGWWQLGWGWVCLHPLLETLGRWPYGWSTPLLAWALLPGHIWPELLVKPATQTGNNWASQNYETSFYSKIHNVFQDLTNTCFCIVHLLHFTRCVTHLCRPIINTWIYMNFGKC